MISITACLDNIHQPWPHTQLKGFCITNLDLEGIREGPLESLLSRTPSVKKLRWPWLHDDNEQSPNDTPIVDLNQMLKSLDQIRDTLEDLTIIAETLTPCEVESFFAFQGSSLNLRAFHRLKHIEVPLPFLMTFTPNVDVRIQYLLPQTLQGLVLKDDFHPHVSFPPGGRNSVKQDLWEFPAIMDMLNSFLETRKTTHPHLIELKVDVGSMDDWQPSNWDAFTDLTPRYGMAIAF
ncbi:hypothetical protein BDZ85DRAFT_125783 [Elsinoe ampelina]|uniref:F-box domain-containing protein n=1 Tax=Elsinoe ampelina TaxID=302913 RepID=A0A6A6G948_9PEZI|nr:hypothetical protein BDZ85DRAFT_125783 [Elsinoe ampelina]